MKTKIIILQVLLVLGCSTVFAQTDNNKGLVLTGKISGGSTSSGGTLHTSDASLSLKLTNTGKKPIILILPYLEFGKWQSTLKWSGYNLNGKKLSYSIKDGGLTVEELKDLAKNLDREKPPQNLTYIMEPGEFFEFADSFEKKVNAEEDTILFLTEGIIEYKISLVKYHPDPDLLEKLQKRWQKYGYLPVDKNGDFSMSFEYPNK